MHLIDNIPSSEEFIRTLFHKEFFSSFMIERACNYVLDELRKSIDDGINLATVNFYYFFFDENKVHWKTDKKLEFVKLIANILEQRGYYITSIDYDRHEMICFHVAADKEKYKQDCRIKRNKDFKNSIKEIFKVFLSVIGIALICFLISIPFLF